MKDTKQFHFFHLIDLMPFFSSSVVKNLLIIPMHIMKHFTRINWWIDWIVIYRDFLLSTLLPMYYFCWNQSKNSYKLAWFKISIIFYILKIDINSELFIMDSICWMQIASGILIHNSLGIIFSGNGCLASYLIVSQPIWT